MTSQKAGHRRKRRLIQSRDERGSPNLDDSRHGERDEPVCHAGEENLLFDQSETIHVDLQTYDSYRTIIRLGSLNTRYVSYANMTCRFQKPDTPHAEWGAATAARRAAGPGRGGGRRGAVWLDMVTSGGYAQGGGGSMHPEKVFFREHRRELFWTYLRRYEQRCDCEPHSLRHGASGHTNMRSPLALSQARMPPKVSREEFKPNPKPCRVGRT